MEVDGSLVMNSEVAREDHLVNNRKKRGKRKRKKERKREKMKPFKPDL